MLVSKPTHGGGAPLGIDLDGGTARISIARPAAVTKEEPAASPGEAVAVSPPADEGQDPPASISPA